MKGKVAIVTGGARGIGRAIVLMLAHEGCNVAFNYRSRKEEAAGVVKEAEALGVKCVATAVDIRDHVAVKEWIESIKKDFGRLDILVNNAGILTDKALMMMAKEEWDNVIETNLTGMYNATRWCIVTFLKQRSGDIVNIASVAGLSGLPRQTNYSASKGGMIAFTKALAKEVSPYGVRVNAVAPGYTETDMLSGMDDDKKDVIRKMIPLRRLGSPEDVANCVKFLLSPHAQYITGQVIQVDGGLDIR